MAGGVADLQIDLPLVDFGGDRERVEDGRLVFVDEFAVIERSDQSGFACLMEGEWLESINMRGISNIQ